MRRVHHMMFGGLFALMLALSFLSAAPRASAHHGGVHRLQLISLYCQETEDNSGPDEAYLIIDGVKVWAASMNNGQWADLSGVPSRTFMTQSRIELWDDDGNHWYDRNDRLGVHYVGDWQAGANTWYTYFTEDDAVYVLYYQVTAA